MKKNEFFNGIKDGKNKLKQAETTTLAALKYFYKKFKQFFVAVYNFYVYLRSSIGTSNCNIVKTKRHFGGWWILTNNFIKNLKSYYYEEEF